MNGWRLILVFFYASAAEGLGSIYNFSMPPIHFQMLGVRSSTVSPSREIKITRHDQKVFRCLVYFPNELKPESYRVRCCEQNQHKHSTALSSCSATTLVDKCTVETLYDVCDAPGGVWILCCENTSDWAGYTGYTPRFRSSRYIKCWSLECFLLNDCLS